MRFALTRDMLPRMHVVGMSFFLILGLALAPACTVGDAGPGQTGDGDGDGSGDGDGDATPSVALSLSQGAVELDLSRRTSITATVTSVDGFVGDATVSVIGANDESVGVSFPDGQAITLTAGGTADVVILLETVSDSLAAVQNLNVAAIPADTAVAPGKATLDVETKNLMEIPFMTAGNASLNSSFVRVFRCGQTVVDQGVDIGQDPLPVRSGTRVIFTNYDLSTGLIVHAGGGGQLQHGLIDADRMMPSITLNQRGGSYGGTKSEVGDYAAGEVVPTVVTATTSTVYCHGTDTQAGFSVVVSDALAAQPAQ